MTRSTIYSNVFQGVVYLLILIYLVIFIYIYIYLFIFSGKTNKEFNLRHDWNSLLSDQDDLLVTKYSKDFFPAADTFVSECKE